MTEYEDVIIGSKAMPVEDWQRMAVFSIVTMVLHSMKIGFFVLLYLAKRLGVKYTDFIAFLSDRKMSASAAPILYKEISRYYEHTEKILKGLGKGAEEAQYGEIYWDVEEASFLRITEKLDDFYEEMFQVIVLFLQENKVSFDSSELREAILYQRARISSPTPMKVSEITFQSNFPDYFDHILTTHPIPLSSQPQSMKLHPKDYQGNKQEFARETVLWGRKSGKGLVRVEKAEDSPYAKSPAVSQHSS